MIEVIRAGIASTFQDAGRPGHAHLGVGRSGAQDPALAAVLNRLVGNDDDAAVIETTGGLAVRARSAVTVASSDELVARSLQPGERLDVASGANGRLWQYLAVRGGFAVEPVLGSRSTDTLAGLGPEPPADGQVLRVAGEPDSAVSGELAPQRELGPVVRVTAGPRRDWCPPDAWAELVTREWAVATTSRVGAKLAGPTLERTVTDELPSEGLVRGAVQVPPDGQPVVMLADHPTTGGYPVIAVVHPDDVALVAQRSAGSTLRFRHYG